MIIAGDLTAYRRNMKEIKWPQRNRRSVHDWAVPLPPRITDEQVNAAEIYCRVLAHNRFLALLLTPNNPNMNRTNQVDGFLFFPFFSRTRRFCI